MQQPLSNTERSEKRTTLFYAALCCGLISLFFMVLSAYFLVIKPHYLTKTSTSPVENHVASWYGSRDALLEQPSDVAFDSHGNLYVADATAGEIVVFDRYGQRVETLAHGVLKTPVSLDLSRDGRMYVVDTGRKELLIFSKKKELVKTVSFTEEAPLSVSVGEAQDVGIDNAETLYVTTASGVAMGSLEGVFNRGYFKAGTADAAFTHASDLTVSRGADDAADGPHIIVADSLGGRVQALASIDASPTVSWDINMTLPGGITSDGLHVYVTDSLDGIVKIFDIQTGQQTGTLAQKGSIDGALTNPRGIAEYDDQIYVADAGNGRIEIYNTPESAGATIASRLPLELYGLIALCVLFAAGSVVCWILRIRLVPQRFIVDFSIAEQLVDERVRGAFEHVTTALWCAPRLSEWVQRPLENSPLKGKTCRLSTRETAEFHQLIAEQDIALSLDDFDVDTLVCAWAHRLTLVSESAPVREAARKLGIELVDIDALIDAALKTEEQVEPDGEEGSVATALLMRGGLLAIAVFIALFASALLAQAHAAGVEHSVVMLSSLQKPTHAQDENTLANSDKTFDHTMVNQKCATCHQGAQTGSADELFNQKSSCEYCHSASNIAEHASVYTVSGGNAHNLGEKNSGHELGLHDGIEASSQTELTQLSCFSCHEQHEKESKDALKTTQFQTPRSCESCHDKARAAQDEVRAYTEQKKNNTSVKDQFKLEKSVKAHQTMAGVDNGNAAHTAAGLTCATCHRASLSSERACSTCHYDEKDFATDKNRKEATSDWPHASANDTALLGAWTTSAQGDNLGEKEMLDGGMTLENQTRAACGRCHTTLDGTNFARSVHTLAHDAVRSGMTEHLTSEATTSTLTVASPGYIATGGAAQQAPFADSFDFGPEDGSFEGVACGDCHYSDVQTEHQLRSKKGCNSCHTTKKDGKTDWTKTTHGITRDAFVSCGTSDSACHLNNWHGTNPSRMKKAHQISSAPAEKTATSCAPKVGEKSCHNNASAQSLFYFGAKDLASAHNDYWIAQKQNYSTNTRYTQTISAIESVRGCGLCHDKQTSEVNGAKQRALQGSAFNCSSCHNIQTAVYAENECYKAKLWVGPAAKTHATKVKDDEITREAKEYLSTLAQSPSLSSESDAQDDDAPQMLKPSMADGALEHIPDELLPVTKPISPLSPFSLVRGNLAPYPSLLNRPTSNWENV